MRYCDSCRIVTDRVECPVCGKGDLTEPDEQTVCFLIEKEMLWGEMLAEILRKNKIPFWYDTVLGAGIALKIGPSFERYRFYVPFPYLEQSRLLVEQVFQSTEAA